jgi:hypothetical protein
MRHPGEFIISGPLIRLKTWAHACRRKRTRDGHVTIACQDSTKDLCWKYTMIRRPPGYNTKLCITSWYVPVSQWMKKKVTDECLQGSTCIICDINCDRLYNGVVYFGYLCDPIVLMVYLCRLHFYVLFPKISSIGRHIMHVLTVCWFDCMLIYISFSYFRDFQLCYCIFPRFAIRTRRHSFFRFILFRYLLSYLQYAHTYLLTIRGRVLFV